MRLVDYLVAAGLAADLRTAQGLVMRGDVLIDERPVTSVAHQVTGAMAIRLRLATSTDVSKGAAKFRPVAHRLALDCRDKTCLDLGVSTGGFTQVLLELGAAKVYAVDVGYGVTAQVLRQDLRVVLLERTNARTLTREIVPEKVDIAVGDLSFISWAAVLPAVVPLLSPDALLLLMVKPQFELAAQGMGHLLDGGVLRDPVVERQCLEGTYNVWVDNRLSPLSIVPAAIPGAKGNQEYFVHLRTGLDQISREEYCELAGAALAEAGR